jgi:aquaporin Z
MPDRDDFGGGRRGAMRRVIAELIGTFALVLVDAGGAVISTIGPDVSSGARSAATGLVITAMAFALGNVSGAHFNPMITLAFALRGAFPWRHVLPYWTGQLAGALAAAAVTLALFGDVHDLGATQPHVQSGIALAVEAIFATLLAFVVLSTATRHQVIGPVAPLAAGAVVTLTGLIARGISDASINPARSLGPAIVGGHFAHWWIYVAGPFLGSFLAWACVSAAHPRHHGEEHEAAHGKEQG